MNKILLVFTAILFFIGCNNNSKIIPEDKLVDILAEMHLADAIVDNSEYKKFKLYDTVIYYDHIFKKYGYNRNDIDSSLAFYSKDEILIKEIYEKVIEKLDYESKMLLAQRNEEIKLGRVNIWEMRRNWQLPQDGSKETIEFYVPLRGLGRYTLEADIKVFVDDQSNNPKINVYFFKKDSTDSGKNRQYFTSMMLEKDNEFHLQSVSGVLTDTTFTHIRGQILSHTNMDNSDWKKHIEVRGIGLYFEPADTLQMK